MLRTVLTAACVASLLVLGTATAWAASGDLDASWSGEGRVATVVTGDASDAWDLAVQDDGKVVAVGSAGPDFQHTSWGLVRYKAGGLLDTTFGGGDGKVTTNWTPGDDEAYAVKILPNGKLLVAGQAGQNLAIARYTPAGKLDSTFGGGDGKVVANLTAGLDDAWDIELLDGGQFLVAGDAGNHMVGASVQVGVNEYDVGLFRFGANGQPDSSFGTDGLVTRDFGASELVTDMQRTGSKFVMSIGRFRNGHPPQMAAVRLLAGGAADTGFGNLGLAPAGLPNAGGEGLAVQQDGKIVVAGDASPGATDRFAVARFLAS
jgi:uncharacterized delta-60 repeat protein